MEPETIEDVLALIEQRPADAELYQLLGKLYLKAGRRLEAGVAFENSLALDPHDPWTHLYLGNWFWRGGNSREALKRFKHAAELLPNEAIVYTGQGDILCAQGRYDLAEEAYKTAVRVDPDNPDAQRTLAEFYEKHLRGTVDVTREMIVEAHQNDHAATTVLLASRWLRDHPDDRGILLDYADMLSQMTRYEEAIRVYVGILSRFEDKKFRSIIFNQLGKLHRYKGILPKRNACIKRRLSATPRTQAVTSSSEPSRPDKAG